MVFWWCVGRGGRSHTDPFVRTCVGSNGRRERASERGWLFGGVWEEEVVHTQTPLLGSNGRRDGQSARLKRYLLLTTSPFCSHSPPLLFTCVCVLQMSGLHALGKLLYAKRLPPTPDDPRGPLSFSPERVVDTNDMHCSSILAFTVHHSPSFFTDCEELSDAYRSFSDADVFVSKIFSQDRDRGETVYPGAYATSLVGRTVAAFNSHPAPRTFHPLTKPPLYENSRKMGENKVTMEGLQARVSEGEISRGGFGEFVTDMLPYLRQIHPTDASLSLSLHSHVRKEQRGSVGKQDSRVLADDDIMDDDSDGW